MKKLLLIFVAIPLIAQAGLIDLTPGGFTPSVTGAGDPLVYQQLFDNLHLDTALSPIFGLGPWRFTDDGGLGGTYLFCNLFDISPTSSAQVSWDLNGQPDGDWLSYIYVVGSDNGILLVNIYGLA